MNKFFCQNRFPVFHVPHDGEWMPAELLESVCIPMDEFLRYHAAMRDAYVSELVPERYQDREHLLRFPISRLLCDVERFIGPEELMERYGMGFCYERVYDGTRIKTVSPRLIARTKVYYNRHQQLLDALCEKHDRILLIDLHSYADELVPKAFLFRSQSTPDVCIGADAAYTPRNLIRMVVEACRKAGLSTAVDYPYAGSLVPNTVLSGRFRGDCVSVMLEIHKRVYLDDQGYLIQTKVKCLQDLISWIVESVKKL